MSWPELLLLTLIADGDTRLTLGADTASLPAPKAAPCDPLRAPLPTRAARPLTPPPFAL